MTIAAINEVPILNVGSLRWALRDGVRPVTETFAITPAGQTTLEAVAPGPVTLRLDVGGDSGDAVEFQNVYIIGFPPGANPNLRAVQVADRRWIWPSTHILHRFNLRRRIGFKRVEEVNLPQQLQPVTPEIQYRRFSVRIPDAGFNGRWLGVDDAFRLVLEEVLEKEADTFGARARIVIRDFPREIPIENLVIDDNGASAINRMLAYFPESGLFIAPNGDVVVYSKASGEESDTVPRAGAELVGTGHVEVVSDRFMRPRRVEALFTKEIEVRLDFRSNGVSAEPSAFAAGDIPGDPAGIDNDFLENVLPLPDYQLTIGGVQQVQGNWVRIDSALLSAWGTPPGAGGIAITERDIRQDFVPFIDQYFSRLQRLGQVDPTANWPPRIAALRQHYRRTFRIHENLIDRIFAIKAERVGNVNFATGQRAPAIAYGDWSVIPTPKYWFRQNVEDTRYVISHSSFGPRSFRIIRGADPSPGAENTVGSKPMPARVSVIDEDQGIIRLDYELDPHEIFQMIIPGTIDNGPSGDVGAANQKNVVFNGITRSTADIPVELSDDYRLAVILTVIPGSPNDTGQLQRIIVQPQEVIPVLPPGLRFNPADAVGPPLEVRIGPGVETARIPWSDVLAPEIFSQIGLGRDFPAVVDSIIVNLNPANQRDIGASLNRIALAEAARVYASFADRFRGQTSTRIRADIAPGGSLDEVVFELDRFGAGTLQLSFPERFEPLTFFALLDASTRAVVLQLATHQRD